MSVDLIIWVLLFGGLLLGMPIFAAIAVSTLILLVNSGMPLTMVPDTFYRGADQFTIIAVPCYVLAGSIMDRGGIAAQIVEVMELLVGQAKGGLAIVLVLGCIFFGAMCGSGPATAAAMGSIMIPSMVKRGYHKEFAAALTATSGTLGIMIPPSNPMIIYAVMANVSVGAIFMTGFLPGIVMGLGLMAMALVIAHRRNYVGTAREVSRDRLLMVMLRNAPALLTPVIILGGIYGGVFTPVEAAVVAVIYSFAVGRFINRKLHFRDVYESLKMANVVSGSIVILISASTLFGQFVTVYQVPIKLANFMLSLSTNPTVILLLITGLLIFLGCFMETLATIIILTPILLPLTTRLGVDPLHLGMIFVVGGVVGFCTPPLGVNLFVSASLTKLKLEQVARATLPFYLPMLLVYLILVLFPDITLLLPRLFLGYK